MKRGWFVLAVAVAACSGKTLSDSDGGATGATGGVSNFGGGGSPSYGGTTPGGGGGFVPNGGTGGVPAGGFGGTPFEPRTGRACATDAECGDGLFCAKATSGLFAGEGPAKGYCTTECSADPSVCSALDGVCFPFGNGAFCMETCSAGPDGLTQFDPDKCHGRQEVACTPVTTSSSVSPTLCIPRCNHDADCGGGLICNPITGRCSSGPAPTGLPIGSPCQSLEEGGTCAGECQTFESTLPGIPVFMCTQGCTLGAVPSCGWSGPGTGPADAACLYPAPGLDALGGPGIGDLGYCGQLCDCDDECLPEYECLPWPGPDAPQLQAFFQRTGYCGVNQVGGDAAVTPCN